MYPKKTTSGRPPPARTTSKGVSSIRYCQEKYCCDGENAEAAYECDECDSLQCAKCESKLHDLPRTTFHDRRQLEPPRPEKLCQLPTCARRNYADVHCDECARRLCFDCSQSVHAQGRKKHHRPARLDSMSLGLADIGLSDSPGATGICTKDGFEDDDFSTTKGTRNYVKPLSLVDSDDNDSLSLTFLTATPQQENCQSGSVTTAAPVNSSGVGDPMEPMYATPIAAPTNMTDCGKATRRHIMEGSANTVNNACPSFLLADQQENLKVWLT